MAVQAAQPVTTCYARSQHRTPAETQQNTASAADLLRWEDSDHELHMISWQSTQPNPQPAAITPGAALRKEPTPIELRTQTPKDSGHKHQQQAIP